MIAGVFSAIAGCSTEDSIRAIILFIIMLFMGGNGEETTTGDSGSGGAAPVTEIVLFSAGVTANGDFKALGAGADGREGADNLCIAAKPAAVTQPNVRAFISVTATDEIQDMPANHGVATDLPIVGPTDIAIADDWPDLFDHGVDPLTNSLLDGAVVTDAANSSFWTGSNADGSLSASCSAWSTASATFPGGANAGGDNVTDATWLARTTVTCDGVFSTELICVAF
jgi:hypothetical protein